MSKKGTKIPDSDQSIRSNHEGVENEVREPAGDLTDRQTSNKTGKHSSVQKTAASRPELASAPGAKQVPGANGNVRKPAVKADSGGDKARRKNSR